jgi:interferon gamma-inducible protein 30
MMNLTIVPYGNAKMSSDGTVTCQHGSAECLGNMYEACSQALYPDIGDFFPFFDCLESQYTITNSIARNCAEKANLSYDKLYSCTTTQQGKDLIKKNAAATGALNPPHEYVPWITVNGKVLQDPSTLLEYVCAAYTGTKPAACSKLDQKSKRCYRED